MLLRLSVTARLANRGGFAGAAWFDYRGRETFATSLAERAVSGGLKMKLRPARKFRIGAETALGFVQRPDWPDQYQPVLDDAAQPTGSLAPTDRYSYWVASGKVFARGSPAAAIRITGFAEALYRDYREDPNYDPVAEPTHLTPSDKVQAGGGIRASAGMLDRLLRMSLSASVFWIHYLKTYARDAQTGKTHAAPGGQPPNPLQTFLRIDIAHTSSIFPPGPVKRISVTLSYQRNEDTFAGYYTWNQAGWKIRARFSPIESLAVTAGYGGRYRSYTTDGYQPGPNHPPLDGAGTVRTSHRHDLFGEVAFSVWQPGLELFLEGRWRINRTNFPDYQPYVFPATRAYRIDWDYTNTTLMAGVRYRTF